jgi:hypothetical protein
MSSGELSSSVQASVQFEDRLCDREKATVSVPFASFRFDLHNEVASLLPSIPPALDLSPSPPVLAGSVAPLLVCAL